MEEDMSTDPKEAEQALTEQVIASFAKTPDDRLRTLMQSLVRHMHAFVREVEPTEAEWMSAIRFLTDTGKMCDDLVRQEFILLSDTLGVSMLVDAINHRVPSGATPNTILGPFYVANAPACENGANICLDGKGEPLVVAGRVTDIEGGPIPNAKIEVWQTNDDGFYDVQQKGIQPDSNLRGIFTSDAEGRYWFRSVKPRHYPIPSDGPVGKLLGAMGRHPNRAAHLHFIVTAPGCAPVITHIFTPDCPYLQEDAVFGVKRELIARFERIDDAEAAKKVGFAAPFWSVNWDFTLVPSDNPKPPTL
jgi:protocatechuate 3,4-dioxygenase beta subunit